MWAQIHFSRYCIDPVHTLMCGTLRRETGIMKPIWLSFIDILLQEWRSWPASLSANTKILKMVKVAKLRFMFNYRYHKVGSDRRMVMTENMAQAN